ncbi:MAG: pyridoxal 5'-phosphate synthase glutaminase subunit PdxT, partial [Lachnospiraceae bacterium]|nr:pyridoxal 5'-phosphate synthase glutaminase subunit PdxT [Lachnospiraceae bacterium]
MKIGVLAVQGAFIEHKNVIEQLGVECIELRQKKDLKNIDGIILPGGESTVQGQLLHRLDMFEIIRNEITKGIPTLATCAGLILLANKIKGQDA